MLLLRPAAAKHRVHKRLLGGPPGALEVAQSLLAGVRPAEVEPLVSLLTGCPDGMPEEQMVGSQPPGTRVRRPELVNHGAVPGQEDSRGDGPARGLRDQDGSESAPDHAVPELAEEPPGLDRHPLPSASSQVQPVEGTGNVGFPAGLAYRQVLPLRAPDAPLYLGSVETRV